MTAAHTRSPTSATEQPPGSAEAEAGGSRTRTVTPATPPPESAEDGWSTVNSALEACGVGPAFQCAALAAPQFSGLTVLSAASTVAAREAVLSLAAMKVGFATRCSAAGGLLTGAALQAEAERRAVDAERERSEAVALAKEAARGADAGAEELRRLRAAHRTREATLERRVPSHTRTRQGLTPGRLRREAAAVAHEQRENEVRATRLYEQLFGSQPRGHTDARVLDVIQVFQGKVRELEGRIGDGGGTAPPSQCAAEPEELLMPELELPEVVDPKLARLIQQNAAALRTAQRRARRAEAAVETLTQSVDELRMELDARPSLAEWRRVRKRAGAAENKLRRAEAAPAPAPAPKVATDKAYYDLGLYRIDTIGAETAREHLRGVLRTFRVKSLDALGGALERARAADRAAPALRYFLAEVSARVRGPAADGAPPLEPRTAIPEVLAALEGAMVRTEGAAAELAELQRLRFEMSKIMLSAASAPPTEAVPETGYSVDLLLQMCARLVSSHAALVKKGEQWAATEDAVAQTQGVGVLAAIVQDVQRLFGIRSAAGVLPAMHAMHSRMAELQTALRSIASAVGLELRGGTVAIAQAVEAMASASAREGGTPAPPPGFA